MAVSWKVQVISTKYFMYINWEHYAIYLQNMKFVWLILWPGGVYTDNTYANKAKIMILYYDEIMNHDYIGSFWQCQMIQKPQRVKDGENAGPVHTAPTTTDLLTRARFSKSYAALNQFILNQ